jgi:hypothetical protein
MERIGIVEILLLVLVPLALMLGLSTVLVFYMALKGKAAKNQERRCSFCGGEESVDSKLFAGRSAFICERCARNIVRESGESQESVE